MTGASVEAILNRFDDPHDSGLVGDEPYVSLQFLGVSKYAR